MAESVAEFIYNEAYPGQRNNRPEFTMNKTLMNELLHCYLVTAKCSLFNLSSTWDTPPTNGNPPSSPYPQYVGVYSSHVFHSIMTGRVLAYLTGETVESTNVTSQKDCKSEEDDVWYYYYIKNSIDDSCNLCKETDSSCDAENVTCGVCKRSLSFFTKAISPAFLIKVWLESCDNPIIQ